MRSLSCIAFSSPSSFRNQQEGLCQSFTPQDDKLTCLWLPSACMGIGFRGGDGLLFFRVCAWCSSCSPGQALEQAFLRLILTCCICAVTALAAQAGFYSCPPLTPATQPKNKSGNKLKEGGYGAVFNDGFSAVPGDGVSGLPHGRVVL